MSRYQRSMRDALQSVADGQMEFDEAVKWEVKINKSYLYLFTFSHTMYIYIFELLFLRHFDKKYKHK